MDLKPPLTGKLLEEALSKEIKHETIIEGFLYKNASLMIASQPSVGKSVITMQACLQMAAGLPVFGALYVPRPQRIWYMQMERPDTESLERIQSMKEHIPVHYDNLFIDTELQKLYFLNPEHLKIILQRAILIKPDVIVIDPLYGVAPGLSKDDVASQLVKTLTILKAELDTTLWINHHHTKQSYDRDGNEINKDDAFYGSQWLKAHITGSYSIEKTKTGTVLDNKKDSHSNLLNSIELTFDHDTYLSTMRSDKINFAERYKMFINASFRSSNRTFYFEEVRKNLGCTIGRLRQLNCTPPFSDVLTKSKSNGTSTLYTVIKEI